MAWRRTLRRGLKWACLSFAGLALTAWACSELVVFNLDFWPVPMSLGVWHGTIILQYESGRECPRNWFEYDHAVPNAWVTIQPVRPNVHGYPFHQRIGLVLPSASMLESGDWELELPDWLLLVCSAGALFFFRARRPRGYCQCGYNLTGNVSGRCPECGADVPERAAKAA